MLNLIVEPGTVVLVDADGTLFDDRADRAYKAKVAEVGETEALKWYAEHCPDDLELNEEVLGWLTTLKAQGAHIYLWTNRGMEQGLTTARNLMRHKLGDFFNIMFFGNGKKKEKFFDYNAIVIDNEPENLDGARVPVLVQTFTV